MGRQSIWEYLRAVYARYRRADRPTKQKMLDKFCANTGYHRKHALRLWNGPPPGRARPQPDHPARRRPTYGKELVAVLKAIWKAAGYPWSVRLKALIPLWMREAKVAIMEPRLDRMEPAFEKLLSQEEAAELLGIHPETLRRMAVRGEVRVSRAAKRSISKRKGDITLKRARYQFGRLELKPRKTGPVGLDRAGTPSATVTGRGSSARMRPSKFNRS